MPASPPDCRLGTAALYQSCGERGAPVEHADEVRANVGPVSAGGPPDDASGDDTGESDPSRRAADGDEEREIPFLLALVPLAALVGFLSLVLLVLRTEAFKGTGHLPLLGAAIVGVVVARAHGHRWPGIERGIVRAIERSMPAILILLVIGMLIGTWLASGVVPALIHWGLSLLSPQWFLPTTCIVCSIVSVVSGSSWTTAGTVGLAMIGIGEGLEVPKAMTAGAVVSGAYFGDKLSPMSDTTNLAPAMAGTDLFTHIGHQVRTTGPAWVVAMIAYTILGANLEASGASPGRVGLQAALADSFDPGLLQVLPPLLILVLVLLRMPALPTLVAGVTAGGLVALAEGVDIQGVLSAAMSGFTSMTGHEKLDELLSRGGMSSMGDTVFLVFCAMTFGGVMEVTGMLQTLAQRLLRMAKTAGSLIATTVLTSLGINVVAADQYIAIVVPGRMYADAYRRMGLHPKNLSRAVEDGGTITSPLIPWNTCGAFMAKTLGVATGEYFLFAVLNLANPVIAIVFGFLGISVARRDGADPPPS